MERNAWSDSHDPGGYSADDALSWQYLEDSGFAALQVVGQKVMSSRIEDEARSRGANLVSKPAWTAFATRDGNLITGQQQHSGAETARLVIEALEREER